MGYELHITRRPDWSGGPSIDLDEWHEVVASDPELRLDGAATATTSDGLSISVSSPGLAVWVSYSGHESDGNMAWFDHREGEIVVKNPDEEIISKMIAIAERLGARVRGDDGELYGPGAHSAGDAARPVAPSPNDRAPRRRWWRRR